MAKVSIILPSRNEKFLEPTIKDCLKNCGDVEVIAVLDGYYPGDGPSDTQPLDPAIYGDPRFKFIHKGKSEGMRQGINSAAGLATGKYLLKLDAHCMIPEGFDLELQKTMEPDWVVVPRRYRLDPFKWEIREDNKAPVDYHYLSYPWNPRTQENGTDGIHGQQWKERSHARTAPEFQIDDEMSSQGSCWFMEKDYFHKQIGPLETQSILPGFKRGYGSFIQEFQEIGLKTWLSGGKVKLNKNTWYAHLYKGQQHGRGYSLSKQEMKDGKVYATKFWFSETPFKGKIHDLRWFIRYFVDQGLNIPTWSGDYEKDFAHAYEAVKTLMQ